MAKSLIDDKQIDEYIKRVINEALHHAPHVTDVIQLLSDNVRKHLKFGIDNLQVYERNGNLARTCWVTINKRRYVFAYNYDAKVIDLRAKSLQGRAIFQFDNTTSSTELEEVINNCFTDNSSG